MDMKKILQAMDGISTKPVEGADSMAKILRVVKEAEINQAAAPVAPTAPAQPQVDPANYQVPSVDFLQKNYKHPADIIAGAHPSEADPTRIGAWAGGSDFDELMMALNGSYYQARKANPNFEQPAFVKDDWELVQRMLGTPEGREYAIANWIGLSNVNDTSPEAEFNRAQHKEFEKQANARFMQQPDGVVTPGWKYDQKLGMTPAQAELQKQKAQQPAPVQENSLSKFLSIVDKNNVSILSEGTNPHKVALPVQMAMQHYQQPKEQPQPRERLIDKYFVEAETEIMQRREEKRALINQYAKTIAERVLMKESAQHVTEAPIAMDPAEPNNPTIHSHEKANAMTLKGRIASARKQLQELAQLAESNELVVWEKITRLSKGGMFMGLEQNLEQIRHGIDELATQRRKGGTSSRGIDKHIGEGKTK
jgi:hypothetical protein